MSWQILQIDGVTNYVSTTEKIVPVKYWNKSRKMRAHTSGELKIQTLMGRFNYNELTN
jgi:hypothetical protein